MFSIDTRSRAPIYLQLVSNITNMAASGALAPDEQLPGVRSLARELGVNPNTVQRAYQELEAQGVIYQAAGRGSFISPSQKLSCAIVAKKLEDLREHLNAARHFGVTKEQLYSLIEQIYQGGETDCL
jgi:GntR family transcriptional regulator